MVVYMVSKMMYRCALSRNRSLRDAKPVCLIRKTLFSGTLFLVSG